MSAGVYKIGEIGLIAISSNFRNPHGSPRKSNLVQQCRVEVARCSTYSGQALPLTLEWLKAYALSRWSPASQSHTVQDDMLNEVPTTIPQWVGIPCLVGLLCKQWRAASPLPIPLERKYDSPEAPISSRSGPTQSDYEWVNQSGVYGTNFISSEVLDFLFQYVYIIPNGKGFVKRFRQLNSLRNQ